MSPNEASTTGAPTLTIAPRLRSTPWSGRIEAFGVKSYTVYNHMLLPTQLRGLEADYHHLRRAVQVWDVGCQRQVELHGPDAGRLAQLLTVRDLRSYPVGRCGYVPLVDQAGHLINDPVALRVGEDRWWFSVSDSDVVLWAGGLACGLGLDVTVSEPDVWPLAVQGPLAEQVVARVFGPEVAEIAFFRFRTLSFRDHDLLVARTGWSGQGGFEIYVDDPEIGVALYDHLMDVGARDEIGPGCPNLIERIEAGLLTYGSDMTREHTPLEAGLDRYCSLDADIDAIGIDALRRQRAEGVPRRIRGLAIGGERVPLPREAWPVVDAAGARVGSVTSAVWSPRLLTNVAIGMIDAASQEPGTALTIVAPDGDRPATVCDLPFADPSAG